MNNTKINLQTRGLYAARLLAIAVMLTAFGGFFAVRHHAAAQEAKPDLTVVDIVVSPPNPRAYDTVNITITYKNIGSGSVTSNWNSSVDFGQFSGLFVFGNNATPRTSGPFPGQSDPLEPGESFGETYSGTFNVAGTRTLKVTVNSEKRIVESNDSNNSFSKSITVLPGGPDLVIQNLFVPNNKYYAGFSFDAADVQVIVKNQGNAPAGSFGVWLYVRDANSDQIQSGPALEVESLAGGETKSIPFDHNTFVNFVNLEAKAYLLEASADDNTFGGAKVAESNENNNTMRSAIFSALPQTQAPAISNIETKVLSAQTTRVSFEIPGVVNPSVHYSTAAEYPSYPGARGYKHRVSAVNDGGGKFHADISTQPNTLYHYRILLESTNVTTGDLTFTSGSGKPDLTITEAFFELQNPVRIGTPKTSERVRVAVNVKNLGADLTNSQGILNWSVSVQDFVWETRPALSATVVFSPSTPLRTGVHTQFQGWGYFNSSGTKSVFLTVDAGNELAETNEANNSFTTQVTVASTDTNLEKPDLVVEKITLDPPVPLINQPVVVTAWVKNIGAVDAFIPNSYPKTGPTVNISVSGIDYVEGVLGQEEPLSPGDTATYVFGSKTPLRFSTSGTYRIQVTVDSDGVIAESNEGNNSLTKTVELASGKVSDLKHTLDGRVVRIFWKTDSGYNCRVVFKGRPDIGDDLLSAGAGISVVYAGENNNAAINLDELSLPNRESDRVFYYRIVCRDKTDGHKVVESDVKKIVLSSSTPVSNAVPPTGTVVQNDPGAATSEEIRSLRERIKKLELRISDLEKQVVERERQLTARINAALSDRLKGRILLQVENKGEAWYVDPVTSQRFYLKDGISAYQALQAFGLGIKNSDLEKIPVGLEERADKIDSDGDGLDDRLEEAIGTDEYNPDTDGDGFTDGEEVKNLFSPKGPGRLNINQSLANRLSGRIVLQVEDRGQAWYIHNGKRYYLKDGSLAYQIMRFLSLGITNDNIRQIGVGELE